MSCRHPISISLPINEQMSECLLSDIFIFLIIHENLHIHHPPLFIGKLMSVYWPPRSFLVINTCELQSDAR